MFTTYETYKKAYNPATKAWQYFTGLEVLDLESKEDRKKIKKSIQDLKLTYFSRREGVDMVLDAISDKNIVAGFSEAKEEFERQVRFICFEELDRLWLLS